MPSISSVLNIAKEALLTHQSSINVAGHNVANVDTPGYSRQVLDLSTSVSTPHRVGFFGNGVVSESVSRQYDQFMVQRTMNQNSAVSNLQAQQQSMRVIETTFNEVPGLAVNDLLSKLWEAWQGLSNNPELSATRQTVVQQAELLGEQFNSMAEEIVQTRFDISVALNSAIEDVNTLTQQLADLNVKITSSETPLQQQNDLRDRRDVMMKELSSLIDITFFESNEGSYTILMADGHSLVETNEHWSLDWANNQLRWLATNSLGTESSQVVGENADLGGKIGGLVTMISQLAEGNPDNYLGRLDALANALIREVNQAHSQGVGLTSFSSKITSSELAKDAVLLHTTVDSATAADTIEAGALTINGREIDRILGSININGRAMGKTYNAVQAINAAEAGVEARLTTLVAGTAVTAMTNAGILDGDAISFTVNGITVSYAVDKAGAPDDTDQSQLANNVVAAINQAIADYNNKVGLTPPQGNVPAAMTIEAVVGTGLNGGALNSVVLRNTNLGDESEIVIAGIENDPAQAAYLRETNLGLANGTYTADATHNTGELSVFARETPITIDGGADDTTLAHLGWAGVTTYSNQAVLATPAAGSTTTFQLNGKSITVTIPAKVGGTSAADTAALAIDQINNFTIQTGVMAELGDGTNGGLAGSIVFSSETSNIKVKNYTVAAGTDVLGFSNFTKLGVSAADESANDGKLTYELTDNKVANSLMGLSYADSLVTDNSSFEIWIYNTDGSLALTQPVTVPLTRAYTLQDVATAINTAVTNAINNTSTPTPPPWVTATVAANTLTLTPDSSHRFAFGGDDSNFLAAAGLNTFFTGYSASTIDLNANLKKDLDHLAAGQVSQFGEIFAGDNSNTLLITNIQRDESITFTGGRTDTLDGYYNSLIAEIGLRGRSINTDLEFNQLVSQQLNEIRDATSGVSLDEEMANLIKYQHAYSAAAKLISVADELMQTLLNTI